MLRLLFLFNSVIVFVVLAVAVAVHVVVFLPTISDSAVNHASDPSVRVSCHWRPIAQRESCQWVESCQWGELHEEDDELGCEPCCPWPSRPWAYPALLAKRCCREGAELEKRVRPEFVE